MEPTDYEKTQDDLRNQRKGDNGARYNSLWALWRQVTIPRTLKNTAKPLAVPLFYCNFALEHCHNALMKAAVRF